MSEILEIITQTIKNNVDKLAFKGEVFFKKGNQLNSYSLDKDIGRHVYNKLLNETNSAYEGDEDLLDTDHNLLLVFILESYEDQGNFWRLKELNNYFASIILEEGIISTWSEENISENSKKRGQSILFWEEIDLIELFHNEDSNHFFRFYYKNEANHYDLYAPGVWTEDPDTYEILCYLFNEIIEYKKKEKFNLINKEVDLKSKIEKLIDNENYKEALEELDNFSSIYDVDNLNDDNSAYYFQKKSLSLFYLGQVDKAILTIEKHIKGCDEAGLPSPNSHKIKGKFLLDKKDYKSALNCLAYSEENFVTDVNKSKLKSLKHATYIKLKDTFLDISYDQRKLIFVGEDIYATQSDDIVILKKNDIPPNINFPIGHPHVNQVYSCHPHKQNFYLPIKSYSDELFLDRINEFCYLLQCLGATKLDISSNKSKLTDQKLKSKKEIDVNIDGKINKAKANYKGEKAENSLADLESKIAKKQVFNPVKAPFVPSNLVWYHSDLNWQRLVDQRLNGSIITHTELMSSSQSENISSYELTQIDVELKLLLPKIGVKYNSEDEISSSSINKHEWLVTVEFEDVSKLTQLDQNSENILPISGNSTNEQSDLNLEKYKKDVLFMIEDDGVIDDYERKFLDRKIKKYGLKEVDARVIENELLTLNYSENELKYIEELKEMLEDGKISNVERKLLNRIALKFKVNDESQRKIDSLYIF